MGINEQTQIPRVITIFSAPNYCDVYKNKGACLKFDDELLNIRQFVSSPHPYYLPNFMDVFTWSLPFVAEKVTDMLYSIVSYENEAEVEPAGPDAMVKMQNPANRSNVLKGKVVAVTKLMRMYKVLKENQDNIIKLKQLSPNGTLPSGILAGGAKSIEKAISSFNDAKAADKVNEAVPMNYGKNKINNKKKKHGPVYYTKSMDDDNDEQKESGATKMKITT